MTGGVDASLGERFQKAVAVHSRHQEIEQNDIDDATLALHELQPAAPVVGEMRDMAEPLDHVRQQPPLHRIVVDDKNMSCHESLLPGTCGVLLANLMCQIMRAIRPTNG